MAEITQESRKKGIAITAILALAAMQPKSKIELMIGGFITAIAIVAIGVQTFIDYKKNSVDKPPKV